MYHRPVSPFLSGFRWLTLFLKIVHFSAFYIRTEMSMNCHTSQIKMKRILFSIEYFVMETTKVSEKTYIVLQYVTILQYFMMKYYKHLNVSYNSAFEGNSSLFCK